jgi:hypothetical protein
VNRIPAHLRWAFLVSSLLIVVNASSTAAGAQSPSPTDSAPGSSSKPQSPAQVPAPSFAFSGVLYTNFQYGGVKGNRAQNRFDLDRAYLNVRARAGERDSIRVTLDVYQQRDTTRDSYYRGWAFRAKYAFAQHEFLRGDDDDLRITAKLGMIQTVVVDKEEQFWPRGLSQVAVEQAGYFSSADMGAASTFTLPHRVGEVYATVVNGTNYSSRELDRFKEYAARLTLTPLSRTTGYWKGLQISPWFSKGERASDFATRRGTVLPVAAGRQRDRQGLLLTVRDARLTLGAHLAGRVDIVERADTARDTAPSTSTRTGRLASIYAIARPLASSGPAPSPFSIVVRLDQVKPDADAAGTQRFLVAGVTWDFSARTSITLDTQSAYPKSGLSAPDTRTVFLHLIANF